MLAGEEEGHARELGSDSRKTLHLGVTIGLGDPTTALSICL